MADAHQMIAEADHRIGIVRKHRIARNERVFMVNQHHRQADPVHLQQQRGRDLPNADQAKQAVRIEDIHEIIGTIFRDNNHAKTFLIKGKRNPVNNLPPI
ncbi:hypothetical protein D3C79_919060 [compost metagenome]